MISLYDKDGVEKICQYSQWVGYPEGVGLKILNFLKNSELVERLQNNLPKVRFLSEKDPLVIEYNQRVENNNVTEKDKIWFEDFISRDVGAKILMNIANSLWDEILLVQDLEGFRWAEWSYLIDFQYGIFSVYKYDMEQPPLVTFFLDNLPTEEEFLKI